MSFESLNLHRALVAAVRDAGYTEATEVQQRAIPPALQGRDLMVSSSTGSGKTASFVLPALTRVLSARNDAAQRRGPDDAQAARPAGLDDAPAGRPARGPSRGPRVLVLVPTRELAIQVSKAAMTYGRHVRGLRVATVVGGVPYGLQLRQLSGALDILIATPGRLMDHMRSGKAMLSNVEMLVLDEADRMLDMGFIDDIQFIGQALPPAAPDHDVPAPPSAAPSGAWRKRCCAIRSASTSARTPTPMPTSSSACIGPTTCSTRMRCWITC